MNFLRFLNAQNGDEQQSVLMQSRKINSNFALATLLRTTKQQNKDTKELLQSLVTTSLTQKKQKQTASKNIGYLPEVLFFNAFELGMKIHQVLSRPEKPKP